MFCQPLGRHTRSRVTKLRHRFLHPDVDMDALANATAGVASFSGADIAGVVRDAASHAMSRAVDASAIGGRELASTVPAALQVRCLCVCVLLPHAIMWSTPRCARLPPTISTEPSATYLGCPGRSWDHSTGSRRHFPTQPPATWSSSRCRHGTTSGRT